MDLVNCKNCGAPLHYNNSENKAICEYCSSEYHLDNLGRIEEYMVELEVYGHRRKFYISEIEIEPSITEFVEFSGIRKIVNRSPYRFEIKLISL